MLENEVDALARAIWSERPENVHTLVALSLRHDNRVVMGLMDDGHLLRSATPNPGYAGGIGHIPVAGNERRCGCGHIGCLETLLRESRTNPECRRQAIDALATIISSTVTAIRPELLVIQGDEQWSEKDMEASARPCMIAARPRPYKICGSSTAPIAQRNVCWAR